MRSLTVHGAYTIDLGEGSLANGEGDLVCCNKSAKDNALVC